MSSLFKGNRFLPVDLFIFLAHRKNNLFFLKFLWSKNFIFIFEVKIFSSFSLKKMCAREKYFLFFPDGRGGEYWVKPTTGQTIKLLHHRCNKGYVVRSSCEPIGDYVVRYENRDQRLVVRFLLLRWKRFGAFRCVY